ncbi:MAG: radical SAM protein [Deltaproteobacteria bacterium]|nr:radical SAM protein [Deltaproteobacteria bacterium]
MKTRFIQAKSALNRSGIVKDGWCLNPYGGCAHACRYCYAVFMKRFYNEAAAWGEFVIVKENILGLLDHQISRRRRSSPRSLTSAFSLQPSAPPRRVWLSSVTDCYQPIESKLRLTRGCLERLLPAGFEVSVLTKSPLVLRDLDLLSRGDADVGLTITTDRADIARVFEERVAPPEKRIETLKRLADAGVKTHAFVGPALPMDPARLAAMLKGAAGRVLIDRMNYQDKVAGIYRSLRLERCLTDAYFREVFDAFVAESGEKNVQCCW